MQSFFHRINKKGLHNVKLDLGRNDSPRDSF